MFGYYIKQLESARRFLYNISERQVLKMFDYNKLIEQYEISPDIAEQIITEIKEEFEDDEMMMELHIIRALKSYALSTLSVG